MKHIKPIELTPENFKGYGHVLNKTAGEPLAKNEEFTYWSKVAQFNMGPNLSTGLLFAHKRPPVIKSLERHTNTPEILVATEGESVICFAKPSEKGDEIKDIQAFRIRQGDGIVMHAGTWHWVGFPTESAKSTLLVIFASDTESDDLEIKDLPEQVEVDI